MVNKPWTISNANAYVVARPNKQPEYIDANETGYGKHTIVTPNEITYGVTSEANVNDSLDGFNAGYTRSPDRTTFSITVPVTSISARFLTYCKDTEAWCRIKIRSFTEDAETVPNLDNSEDKLGERVLEYGVILGSSMDLNAAPTDVPMLVFNGTALKYGFTGIADPIIGNTAGNKSYWGQSGSAMFDEWYT